MPKAAPSNKIMRLRMSVVLACFMVMGFGVIIARLFIIQIAHGEMYQQRAVDQQTRATMLGAKRGTIYDRNGNVLAQSAPVWNVCISPADINKTPLGKEGVTLDRVATDLAAILDIPKEKVLQEAANRGSYYRVIKYRVDRSVFDQVMEYILENEITGNSIFFEEDTKRYYTYGSLASTVLGFTNFDNQGAYGLEAYYNSVLSGTSGMVVSAKNAWGSDMPFKYQRKYDAKDGDSIVLTIDGAVQHFLERHLETAVVEHSINMRASGIVMNVKTGEILAMATKPDFNPNDPYTLMDPEAPAELERRLEKIEADLEARGMVKGTEAYQEAFEEARRKAVTNLQYDQWRNKAISDPYEPGSVFKIITAAAALDNNKVSFNDHFSCGGSLTVSGVRIRCWKHAGHGGQNFVEGMQSSCNPVFMTVGQRLGAPAMWNYMHNFGLGEPTRIDLPGEADSILPAFDILNKPGLVELSSTSMGQTFKITPLQLITAVSASVNGGKLMQPFIVKQILDPEGNVIETTQPTVRRQVISEETSAAVRHLVEQVVAEGSGRNSRIPGYRIGGKTGTSEKLDVDADLSILSFVGFAPMDDPQIAVLVMLDEPDLGFNQFGSTIAAPVVGAVLSEVLPYLNFEPQFTEEQLADIEVTVPNLLGQKPHDAQAVITNLGLRTRMIGRGASVLKQIPQPGKPMPRGGTVIIYTDEETLNSDITIPNFVGMEVQEANKIIAELGLNIHLRGKLTDGVPLVVEHQVPAAGSTATTGDVITITLAERAAGAPPVNLALEWEIRPPTAPVASSQ